MATKTVSPPQDSQPPQQLSRNQVNAQNKKNELWVNNVHLKTKHEDPTVKERLAYHNELINADSDKYCEYLRHVENQKR